MTIGYTNFRKTTDKNIILADKIEPDQGLYIDKLEKLIVDMQQRIDNIVEPISNEGIADERVLALITMHNDQLGTAESLEKQKALVRELLDKCLGAK